MMNEFYNEIGISLDNIDLYVDFVKEYGNMVSASTPVAFCRALDEGKIKKSDMVMFMGTAAGLTANVLVFKY